jgi:lysophospholipase L1-like esterase
MTISRGLRIPSRNPVLLGLAACALGAALEAADAPPFGANVQLRGDLDNCRTRFVQTRTGNVAFLGGSITEMDGYRPMVAALLAKRFPETVFTVTNAGIASTCSTTGAFRLEDDVLRKGPVDLLFVEFAVNDDQDGHHTRTECIRGLEGIVRHARQANPRMDIVVTFFVNPGMMATLKAGKTPLSSEAHAAVAARYDLPTIDLAKEVTEEIGAGTLTWETYGGVHPAPAGNAICAHMIDELMTRAWRAGPPATPAAHPLPEPLDPLSYAAGRSIDPARARPAKGWTLGVPDWKALPGSKRERFTAIPMLCASEPGAEATLPFTGTAVGAYLVAGPDAGIAEASIDGGPFTAVDTFHEFSKGLHYPRTVMFATDLAPGAHTLVLRVAAGTRSGGHALRIMRFVAN